MTKLLSLSNLDGGMESYKCRVWCSGKGCRQCRDTCLAV